MQTKPWDKMTTDEKAGQLWSNITGKLRGNPKAQQVVTNHVRFKTGHATLPAYHNNGATTE